MCGGHTVKFLSGCHDSFVSCNQNTMELSLTPAAICELRSVIRFLTAKNKNATEIHRELCSVYGENIMSRSMVSRWRQTFIEGRTTTHDEQRSPAFNK